MTDKLPDIPADSVLNQQSTDSVPTYHPPDSVPTHHPPDSVPIHHPPDLIPLVCPQCKKYLNLAFGLRDKLLALSTTAQAAHTRAEADYELSMRRAAGYHQLHEAVILKEQHTGAPIPTDNETAKRSALGLHRPATALAYPETIDDVLITGRSRSMAMNAANQLSDLKSLPISLQKWTWGAELTQIDLHALADYPTTGKVSHSGYVDSLPNGRLYQ